MVYVVEMREWDYEVMEMDEVRVFSSREGAERFLRDEEFKCKDANGVWYRGKDCAEGRIRECELMA